MPLSKIRTPLIPLSQPARETDKASLADLIREVALSVADAQRGLDASSAEMVRELAETRVKVVPAIHETIAADGRVSYRQEEPHEVSLLEIGVNPTFYQFAQTVIEVQMDLKMVETESESGTRSAGGRLFLQADTAGIRFERKLNRDVSVCSKVTATLVPVPMPLRVEPIRTTANAPEDDGG
ncbi:hypothetical protein [Desulfurivibrio sp. C05AmB]|uniref:hypothetical protein n=1 Tax=Desulfurivibrio sp. C05AmB TaxID=3374371 RepID=UPI00376EDEC7